MKYQKGFTLIELIVVLVLVGLLASLAGMGLVTGVQGYLLSSENAEITQKAQLAMTRLTREVMECTNCGGTSGAISLPFDYTNPIGNRRLEVSNGNLMIGPQGNTDVLVNIVHAFTLNREDDGRVTILLRLNHVHGGSVLDFGTSIFPRNTEPNI